MSEPGVGADNAPRSYRCSRCGNTFSLESASDAVCPVCGFNCRLGGCLIMETSDEGY